MHESGEVVPAGDILVLEDGTELAVTRFQDVVYLVSDRYPIRLTQGDVERLRAALAFKYLEQPS